MSDRYGMLGMTSSSSLIFISILKEQGGANNDNNTWPYPSLFKHFFPQIWA